MEKIVKKQYVIVILGLIVVLALGYLRCKPIIAKAQELRAYKSDQNLEAEYIRNQIDRMPSINLRMDKLQSQVGDYYNKIPQDRDFANLWDQIAEVMKSHQLKDQLIQPNEEVVGEEINSITITIKCSGSFEQLFNFMNDLEQFERVIRIEDLKLVNNLSQPGTVSMDAQAKIYYQFEDQEKTKA